ncbi:MAG: 23S rRNA (adenine(2503)-C(2))-methyltransferase RlmN [Clostridiales bacterium]|nr:23S rRNA (adenine(2503)-C(2))-methyltransferase RlmN [Clostridiales bacterium]
MQNRVNLLDLSLSEITSVFEAAGIPKYRAGQVYQWLMKGKGYEQMGNLPKTLREQLQEMFPLSFPVIAKKLVSKLDSTVKYLFRLHDGQCIESVVMQYKHGYSICVSSQAGCRMGCGFCASTLRGLVRNLTPGEILSQIIVAQADLGIRISNVVMMGIGEPFDNFENVVRFLQLVNAEEGLQIGYRHISLSTCGVVEGIERLSAYNFPITLSISLHFTDNEQRSKIMPINRKWNIETLLTACSAYFAKTGRRISFEYTLIKGINDTPGEAEKLAKLLKKHMGRDVPFHINLIPVNEVTESGMKKADKSSVERFCQVLTRFGCNATVRRTLGADVNASCGQLRLNEG